MTHVLKRRALLAAGSALLPISLVGACASVSSVDVSQIAEDVALVASGVKAILASIGTVASSSAVTSVQSALSDIQVIAVALANAGLTANATTARSWIQTVASAADTVAKAVATLAGLPPVVQTALAAIEVLLPAIEAAVGLAVPASAQPDAVARARDVLAALA